MIEQHILHTTREYFLGWLQLISTEYSATVDVDHYLKMLYTEADPRVDFWLRGREPDDSKSRDVGVASFVLRPISNERLLVRVEYKAFDPPNSESKHRFVSLRSEMIQMFRSPRPTRNEHNMKLTEVQVSILETIQALEEQSGNFVQSRDVAGKLRLSPEVLQRNINALESADYLDVIRALGDQDNLSMTITDHGRMALLNPGSITPALQQTTINFHNVANVGMINTGHIEHIAAINQNIDHLSTSGWHDVAESIRQLNDAIASAKGDIDPDRQTEMLQVLEAISVEAVAPPDKRRTGPVRALISHLREMLHTTAAIAEISSAWDEHITSFFNIG